MKRKGIIILIIVILLFSGCINQKIDNQKIDNHKVDNQKVDNQRTVKIGDNVSVDYIGTSNGKIFDTTIETVAKENNLSMTNKTYKPIRFIVGKGSMIKGFEDGIIGMKVGESKKLTIPPENAYGQKNPQLIQIVPIVQTVPRIRTFPKAFEMPINQFKSLFGLDNHKTGDTVKIPDTNVNVTILNINANSSVLVSYNLSVGSNVSSGVPWNDTVIKMDDKNITVRSEAKKGDTFQFGGVPWNTTVIDVDSDNLTLMHNKIPDTRIQNGLTRVHFNETSIIMDQNHELAGETLIFDVTIKSIN